MLGIVGKVVEFESLEAAGVSFDRGGPGFLELIESDEVSAQLFGGRVFETAIVEEGEEFIAFDLSA